MKNKIFKSLGAAALVGLTACSLTSCSFSEVKNDIKDWFNGDKEEPATTDEKPTVDGTTTDVVDGIPTAVLFKKASINTSLTINATVTPEDASDKTLTWSLAYADGSSANDIGNYIVSTVTNDTHTVTLAVSKVFSKQILLKCRTVDGVETSTTIDIVKQIENITITSASNTVYANGSTFKETFTLNNPNWNNSNDINVIKSIGYDVVGTVGTVTDVAKNNTAIKLQWNETARAKFASNSIPDNCENDNFSQNYSFLKYSTSGYYLNAEYLDYVSCGLICQADMSTSDIRNIFTAVNTMYASSTPQIDLTFSIGVTYNGSTVKYPYSLNVLANANNYVATTGLSFSQTGIVIK